jgi:hypothetical protein
MQETAISSTSRLVRTSRCPICGSGQFEASDGMATGRDGDLQGIHYIKHGAAALGMSVEQFVEHATTYRCLSCRNYFCDPWFSPELAASLFCVDAPDHLFAWGAFENWLHRRPPGETRNERLYMTVRERIGPIASYAEFACPFQGFLMTWRGHEMPPARRLDTFSAALRRPPDVRWSRISRVYNALQRGSGRIAVLALRARGLLVKLSMGLRGSRGKSSERMSDVGSLPQRRYLLTRDTSIGWGSNCVRFGGSCRYFASTVLGASVLPMHEARSVAAARFDLIGVFNSLDHTAAPLEVIRELLQLSKHVLLVTHYAKHAGKQHWFAFSDDFSSWLREALPGVAVEDLVAEPDRGEETGNYILLSK